MLPSQVSTKAIDKPLSGSKHNHSPLTTHNRTSKHMSYKNTKHKHLLKQINKQRNLTKDLGIKKEKHFELASLYRGAAEEIRTPKPKVGHYHLKVARLPVSPPPPI